jgi:hypothetical protein
MIVYYWDRCERTSALRKIANEHHFSMGPSPCGQRFGLCILQLWVAGLIRPASWKGWEVVLSRAPTEHSDGKAQATTFCYPCLAFLGVVGRVRYAGQMGGHG